MSTSERDVDVTVLVSRRRCANLRFWPRSRARWAKSGFWARVIASAWEMSVGGGVVVSSVMVAGEGSGGVLVTERRWRAASRAE